MTATTHLKPLPVPDALTQPFWDAAREGRLLLQRCAACGTHQHYPRPHCIHCGAGTPEWVDASGRAVVHTFTVTYRNDAPGFGDETPYVFAILELEEGVRMAGNVLGVDPEAVTVGMAVEVTFVAATPEIAIPQWRPVGA